MNKGSRLEDLRNEESGLSYKSDKSNRNSMNKTLRLEDLEVYKVAMEIGEIVWSIVIRWEYFEKKTLGAQLVDAADSIAFNISEA